MSNCHCWAGKCLCSAGVRECKEKKTLESFCFRFKLNLQDVHFRTPKAIFDMSQVGK